MKKVGIITFHNAHNWGASLQLYALKRYLEESGYQVKVINYRNTEIESNYLKKRKIKCKIKNPKTLLKYIFLWMEEIYSRKQYNQKWNKFNHFINDITDNEKVIEDIKEIENMDVDYFVFGSDQIWNHSLTNGFDGVYFGDFKTNAKKISYAASLGFKELPEKEEEEFKKLLQNFNAISVREEALKDYIKKISNQDVTKVLDPTLLLNKEKYLKIAQKPDLKKKYLLLYTLVDNKKLIQISQYIAQKLGLEIVELRYSKTLKKIGKKQIANIGPEEFLGLINGAEFIITNSFHGTVFSILFHKKFYTIPISKVNSRIENLLEITKLEKRCIREIEEVDLETEIDYKQAEENLQKEKNQSINFLEKSLS